MHRLQPSLSVSGTFHASPYFPIFIGYLHITLLPEENYRSGWTIPDDELEQLEETPANRERIQAARLQNLCRVAARRIPLDLLPHFEKLHIERSRLEIQHPFFDSGVLSPLTVELASIARSIDGIGYAHAYGAFNLAYGIGTTVGPVIGGQVGSRFRFAYNRFTVLDATTISRKDG
ncbi:uncharacterized protein EV420DRAFT_1655125 [Desarmillaria tabescens]|uniref:Uncharacterized protein n=1 Tax=Armillaria tabescens TaxID=1929756 RepID=A0AA39J0C1_ARMTA|nr:uncharacterized protein EV420DRAFT_1655125 [Desarmillaria tabescens]KAK0432912.1 hypothetical protein EV420DRAFT_1655125 [Desarmillaria tabescens]